MSSYIGIQDNSSFNAFLKNNEYNKTVSQKEINTKSVDKNNTIEIKENKQKNLTTEEILSLYKNISQI